MKSNVSFTKIVGAKGATRKLILERKASLRRVDDGELGLWHFKNCILTSIFS